MYKREVIVRYGTEQQRQHVNDAAVRACALMLTGMVDSNLACSSQDVFVERNGN